MAHSISSGGEGEVFETKHHGVAKIYRPGQRFHWREDKLKAMVRAGCDAEAVAWPQQILRNAKGNFVGFIMQKASGEPLTRVLSELTSTSSIKQSETNWDRLDLVKICTSFAMRVTQLHQNGIILGDINPGNIIVCPRP